MGRVFVFLGGVLVLLLTAALIVPPFIDWTGYRADFEREASRILGRPVTVAGSANARLLPFPSVTFSDVRVGDENAEPVMTVEKFSMDAELMPFLRGQILIFDMRMEKPHAVITLDEAGKVDWAIRPSTPLKPAKIELENLRITDGSVTIRDRGNSRDHVISDLNATMAATSLAGPWRFDGQLALDGQKAGLEVTTGEIKPEGTLRVRARVRPQELAAVFETDGDMALADGKLSYDGTFALRSSDVAEAAKPRKEEGGKAAIASPATVSQEKPVFADLRVSGNFSADHASLDMPEFRMEQGPADNPYVVNGNALFDYGSDPRFMIRADGQQVLLDGIGLMERGEGQDDGAVSEPVPAVPLSQRIAAFRRLMDRVPIPTIPGSVDLSLPAIIAGDTTIRDVTVEAEPGGDGWNIKQLKADLPGRTKIEAKGKLVVGPDFGFDGDLLMASRQPSGFAAWLTSDVDEAIRRLPAAGFSGRVSLHEGVQRADDLELALGGASLKGSFVRQSGEGTLPSMQLALEGGALDGDALEALATLFASDSGTPRLSDQNIDVRLKAGPVSHGGFRAASVDTAFRLRDGRFDIDRLILADVAGATLTATGMLEPFKQEPNGSVDATILSEDLSRLIATLAKRYPTVPLFTALAKRAEAYPGLFSDSEITLVGSAVRSAAAADRQGGNEFSFSANGKAGGMTIGVSGMARGNLWENAPLELSLTADAETAEGEALMALIGLPALPLGLAGELDANLSLQGVPSEGMKTQLTLKAPDGSGSIDGVFTLRPDDLTGSGKAVLKSADLQPFAAAAGYALPGFGEGLPVDLETDFQFAKGIVRLPNLAGTVNGETIAAKLEASPADDGAPQLKGEVKAGRLDLEALAAFMLGPQAFEMSEAGGKRGVWPDSQFANAPTFPLLADLTLGAETADAGWFGTVTGFSAKLVKGSDALNLNDLAGTLHGGKLGGTFGLRNTGGTALASTQFTWEGGKLDGLYRLQDGGAPLGGTVKLSASLNGTGKSVDELVGSMAGSGVLAVDGLSINGFNQDALQPIIAAADKADSNTPAAAFDVLAAGQLGSGAFIPGPAELAFTVAGGTARVPSFQLETDKVALSSDFRFDLAGMTIGAQGAFTFKPGAEALVGAEPVVRFNMEGPYRDPSVTFDRQPLVQFLTQRALEREQDRVEAMQAALVEKQRLRREVALYQARAEERQRAEEEARRKAEEEARARAEAARLAAKQEAVRRAQQVPAWSGSIPADRPPAGNGQTELPQDGQSLDEFLKTLEGPSP
ncbi:cell envelope biogenesis protein AsmA [Paramesorhizobium deserti]|uniref:Cell envelope biogenesis protein AsmA n=1 Tax=Paramesorhizobium deserti TaxID=1494590 RepID=A0A135HUI1_9HYPH|nr:AsmA family protein [Paramesorhizobium deserti]KXF76845.1 cell envelope biogenesis protein AsmA [Paramesorhizobium deserti]